MTANDYAEHPSLKQLYGKLVKLTHQIDTDMDARSDIEVKIENTRRQRARIMSEIMETQERLQRESADRDEQSRMMFENL